MSNEELVALIQSGENRYEELYNQNRGLIANKARQRMAALGENAPLEFDDLMQAGYLALVAAVSDYTPGEWKFTTFLGKCLKTAFAEATGFRTKKGRNDPIHTAIRLDAPMKENDEGEESEIYEVVANPAATTALKNAEDKLFLEQLRKALTRAMEELTPTQRETLYQRFWCRKNYEETGAALGITGQTARTNESRSIRKLQHGKYRAKLLSFYNFDYYNGTGLSAFMHTGASVQERYLERKERLCGE